MEEGWVPGGALVDFILRRIWKGLRQSSRRNTDERGLNWVEGYRFEMASCPFHGRDLARDCWFFCSGTA